VPFATSRANSRLVTLEWRAAIQLATRFNGFGARCRRKSKLAAARLAWGNRESGRLSLRCRAGDLNWQARLAPARNCPHTLRRRIVSDTLPADSAPDCLRALDCKCGSHPSRRSPGTTFCRQRVRSMVSRWRDCAPENTPMARAARTTKVQPGFADGWHEGCNSGRCTRAIIFKAAPCRIPLAREPSAMGPRRLPACERQVRHAPRPTARFIEDNSVLCNHRLRRCHADCFPPSPAAHGRPPRGSHRANLQASFMPAVRAAVSKVSAGKNDLCFRLPAKIRYRQPCRNGTLKISFRLGRA